MGRNKGLYVFGLLMLLIYWGMALICTAPVVALTTPLTVSMRPFRP